ncbi:MAG: hypothetical protein OXG79_05880 [Chloroflexi bacterium]|nr:hypothetical protein [Chloroflexota bacterium]
MRLIVTLYHLAKSWFLLARIDQTILYMGTGCRFVTMVWARRLYGPIALLYIFSIAGIYLQSVEERYGLILLIPIAAISIARAVFPDITNQSLQREIFRCAYHADMKSQAAHVNINKLMHKQGEKPVPLPVGGDFRRMQESLTNQVKYYNALKGDAAAAIGGLFLRR